MKFLLNGYFGNKALTEEQVREYIDVDELAGSQFDEDDYDKAADWYFDQLVNRIEEDGFAYVIGRHLNGTLTIVEEKLWGCPNCKCLWSEDFIIHQSEVVQTYWLLEVNEYTGEIEDYQHHDDEPMDNQWLYCEKCDTEFHELAVINRKDDKNVI